jgi:hypothetical protein
MDILQSQEDLKQNGNYAVEFQVRERLIIVTLFLLTLPQHPEFHFLSLKLPLVQHSS